MVTVVVFTQFGKRLFITHSVCFPQGTYIIVKIIRQLFFIDAANVRIIITHRNIIQIIEVTEHTYFAEFRHARQHRKFDVTVF